MNNEKDLGADAAAVDTARSAEAVPQLSHGVTVGNVVESLNHVIAVCMYQTCDLGHFEFVRKFAKALEAGRVVVMTRQDWENDLHKATISGIELEQIAAQRAEESLAAALRATDNKTVNDAIRRILHEGGTTFQIEQRLTRYVLELIGSGNQPAMEPALTPGRSAAQK